jgi:deoxyribonuclease V
MKYKELHSWNLDTSGAREVQLKLAHKIKTDKQPGETGYIAGIDVSRISRDRGRAAIVVLSYPDLKIVEMRIKEEPFNFPYIPGFLSFREAPVVLSAIKDLEIIPDLLFFDGQGIAHPRRLGIASHLGLILDIPSIGCAKSRLCGTYDEVPEERGSYSILYDNGEIIGRVLRTRTGVKPVFISVGHKIDLESSTEWALKCCRGYRLPEPCRLAHMASVGSIRTGSFA